MFRFLTSMGSAVALLLMLNCCGGDTTPPNTDTDTDTDKPSTINGERPQGRTSNERGTISGESASVAPPDGIGSAERPVKTPSAPRQTALAEPDIVPPTDKAAQEFAERFDEAVNSGDLSKARGMFDSVALAKRATLDVELPAELMAGLHKGISHGFLEKLIDLIQREIAAGGDYTLRRVYDVDGEKRALFRLRGSDGSINYHEFFLKRSDGGQVQAYDAFIFLSGETLSETMRDDILPLAMEQGQGLRGWTDEQLPSVLRRLDAHKRMRNLIRAERSQEALDFDRTLPEAFRQEMDFLILRLHAARRLKDEDEYLRASGTLRRLYPDNPTIDLVSIDYFLLNGRYEKCLAVLKRLDRTVGGDGHLHILMAAVYSEMGRPDDAKHSLERAVAIEPTLEDAYAEIVSFSLEKEQFDEVLKWLKATERQFSPEWNDLREVPEFGGFVQSPQYQAWLAYLRQKDGP